jgi:hypothetical protein
VNFTDWCSVDGFLLETTFVVETPMFTVCFTVPLLPE